MPRFLKASAVALLMQIVPGCGPGAAPRIPTEPVKALPPAQVPKASPNSEKSQKPAPVPTPVPSAPLIRVPSGSEQEQVNQTLLSLQNAERARNEKPPLTLDPKLTEAAKVQAAYCATHHELTHKGDDDDTVGDRVTAQGYKWSAVAENAEMQSSWPEGSSNPDPRTAERAVQAWMKSPGHRANLLGDYSQCGACYADASDGTRYWIVTFGTPQKSR